VTHDGQNCEFVEYVVSPAEICSNFDGPSYTCFYDDHRTFIDVVIPTLINKVHECKGQDDGRFSAHRFRVHLQLSEGTTSLIGEQ